MPVAVVTDSTAYLPPELVRRAPADRRPADRRAQRRAKGWRGWRPHPADATRALERAAGLGDHLPAGTGAVRADVPPAARRRRGRRRVGAPVRRPVRHRRGGPAGRRRGRRAGSRWSTAAPPAWGSASRRSPPPPPPTAGADLAGVRDAALAAVDRTTICFYVDTLEFLRRGGRINAAEALLGTALSVKPIMHMPDGAIVVRDKVRTASRGVARLVDLAVEAAGDADVDLGVHHLAAPQRAEALVDRADRAARRPAARHVRLRGRRGGRRARRPGTGQRGRPPPAVGGLSRCPPRAS